MEILVKPYEIQGRACDEEGGNPCTGWCPCFGYGMCSLEW